MRMIVSLKTNGEFEEELLNNPLVQLWFKTWGIYNYVAYLPNVTVQQAITVVTVLANNDGIEQFTPLFERI